MTEETRQARIDAYVKAEQKSVTVAIVLAVLLGPIGYLYTSLIGGFFMIVVVVVVVIAGLAPLAALAWIACAIGAPFGIAEYNRKVRAKAELIAG